ncbi:4a-hydroxytetrahydrobiopterin dehydratase [Geodermatophilus sp. DSM 45219]|nr:4a-hydroxytetrahydrobiopterin dehydratase [Geodermatophilus sp. DSM 45219]
MLGCMALTALEPQEIAVALEDLVDWRRHPRALATAYEAGSVPAALELVAAIGVVAEETGHHPDVDWRYRHVFVRTTTRAAGNHVTERDTALAARISALAGERGIPAVPAAARSYEIGVDADDPAALAHSWAAALGYQVGPEEDEVTDPFGRGPTVWFQRTDSPSTSRLHLDVHVADELQGEVVAAVGASGGRTLDPSHAPSFVVVADPDGNRFCICTVH